MNSIKTGSTFSASLKLLNSKTKQPIIIDDAISINVVITNLNNKLISNVDIQIPDQNVYTGFIILEVNSNETNNWPIGDANLNLTFKINDKIIKADSYKFMIERG